MFKLFKKLFVAPPEPEQEQINLGKFNATLLLKDGRKVVFPFEGMYYSSSYMKAWKVWFDNKTTAFKRFEEWRDAGFARGSFLVTNDSHIPAHEIKEIIISDREDKIITTDRKW